MKGEGEGYGSVRWKEERLRGEGDIRSKYERFVGGVRGEGTVECKSRKGEFEKGEKSVKETWENVKKDM